MIHWLLSQTGKLWHCSMIPKRIGLYKNLCGTKILCISATRRCRVEFAKPGEALTEASFEIFGDDRYFRIQATDANGKHADTNV